MTLKDEGYKINPQILIEAQDEMIKSLHKELHILSVENLRLKQHMQVLVMHPVGVAAKVIHERYSREKITKELQISSQN